MRLILATIFAFTLSLLFSSNALATALPPNDLHKMDRIMLMDANMTQQEYDRVIAEVVTFMQPYFATHGATFVVESNWLDSTVNAYADQEGMTWKIMMFGGLARRPEISSDGFSFVACHEVGHHLGGFPFYYGLDWAASEGQSDYFATHTCLRNIWAQTFEENKKAADTVDVFAKLQCDNSWATQAERNLCYRIANAGKSFADLIYSLESEWDSSTPPIAFNTPDPTVVTETYDYHPPAQCRLDTVFQGALCTEGFDLNVIPAKGHAEGQDSLGAEEVAANYACLSSRSFTMGMRPSCWYKSRL